MITRRASGFRIALALAVGLGSGWCIKHEMLEAAVIVSNAKADLYALRAVEIANECAPPPSHWPRRR